MYCTHEEYLEMLHFEQNTHSLFYNPLGKTYSVDSTEFKGNYWFYETDDFVVDIHDFYVKKDITVSFGRSHYTTHFYINSSFFKSAHIEQMEPYKQIRENTIVVVPGNVEHCTYSLHKDSPFFSVGMTFKEKMIKEYIHLIDVEEKNMIPILLSMPDYGVKGLEKIANEILEYQACCQGSKLFYEAKAREWLCIMLNTYFDKPEQKLKDNEDEKALSLVEQHIAQYFATNISQDVLCQIALMSKTKLKSLFKEKHHMTITEYIQRKRMYIAQELLIHGTDSIEEIARSVGYLCPSRFSKLFRKYIGVQPNEIRKRKQ